MVERTFDPLYQIGRIDGTGAGWHLIRVYYDGRPPEPDPLTAGRGRSLAWCHRVKAAWEQSSIFNDGSYDLSVEPVEGWSSLNGDWLAVLVHGVHRGDVLPEAALAQLRRDAEKADAEQAVLDFVRRWRQCREAYCVGGNPTVFHALDDAAALLVAADVTLWAKTNCLENVEGL